MKALYNLKKIHSFIIFLIFICSFFVQSHSASGESSVNTYICNGDDNLAYKSGNNYDTDPDDKMEFSSYEYNIISANNSNCVDCETLSNRPTHIFNFSINEEISYISRVDIFWKGYGTATSSRRDGFNIVITSHYGCYLEISDNVIASSSASEPDDISVSITDNFENIIQNGYLELIAASSFIAGSSIGDAIIDNSYLYSCYVELKIFYSSSGNNPDPESELIINAPSSVEENEDFEITVNSDSQPVDDAEITFNNSNYYTNEQGKITLKAPLVDQDSIYTIGASKTGFISNSTSIEIQNIEEELPSLEIISDSTVYENNTFEIEIFSEGSPIENALVKFDNEEYLSDQNGKVSLISPLVDVDSGFVVNVSKLGYVSSEKIISVLNSVDIVNKDVLVIDCVSSVLEGGSFDVSVICDGEGVGFVDVLFAGDNYVTDNSGFLTLSAPLVDVDSGFVVNVSKSGYVSSEKTITVKNKEEAIYYRIIKGMVTNQSGVGISDVKICVFNKSGWCNYTNKNGEFDFTIPVGEYILESEKAGYEKRSVILYVEKDTTKWINFSLNKTREDNQQAQESDNQLFFEYVKKDQILKGLAGAELSNTEDQVLYYSDKIEIEIIQSSENLFEFSVSANKSTSKKIIFVEMTFDDYSNLDDLEDISIIYDDQKIQRRGIDFLINSNENTPAYSYLESLDDNGKPVFLVAILIPSFSEHFIEITPILKYYDSFGFFIFYIVICLISSIVFVGSIFLRKQF